MPICPTRSLRCDQLHRFEVNASIARRREDQAKILEVPKGTPLQHVKQVDFDTAGRPVMRSLEWHVPSVIELRVYRRGPGPMPL